MTEADVAEALAVKPEEWRAELPLIQEWFAKIGDQLPEALHTELATLTKNLG
jgi:phosphoenolpyruvate carboxykinase (GTP)